jgi:hypothetical protein
VVYNPDAQQYLVTFTATIAHWGPASWDEHDIFGQRLDGATGAEIGVDDFRISVTGPDGDGLDSILATADYSSVAGHYLVAWTSGKFTTTEQDAFAQLLDGSTGAEVGPDDFRVSFMAPGPGIVGSGNGGADAVIANDDAGTFLVSLVGDPFDPPEHEREIYAQLVDPFTATLIGSSPLQISGIGPAGDKNWYAALSTGAHRTGTAADHVQFLGVVVPGDWDETALFFQEVLTCPGAVQSAEIVTLGLPANPLALMPGLSGGPVLGHAWDPFLDHSSFLPGAVLDALVLSATPLNVVTVYGTLLCDPTGWPIFTSAPDDAFAIPVPAECLLAGQSFRCQGASITAGGVFALCNGLDFVVGTLP